VGDEQEALRELGPAKILKPKSSTPSCPACEAKFQHDNGLLRCKACGLPDEVAAKGTRAVAAWRKAQGLTARRGGSFHRRRKAHGRPRGARKVPR
jgi:predicted amidophosphoribosyltransferase